MDVIILVMCFVPAWTTYLLELGFVTLAKKMHRSCITTTNLEQLLVVPYLVEMEDVNFLTIRLLGPVSGDQSPVEPVLTLIIHLTRKKR
jgi:hypothetical protein